MAERKGWFSFIFKLYSFVMKSSVFQRVAYPLRSLFDHIIETARHVYLKHRIKYLEKRIEKRQNDRKDNNNNSDK